MKAIFKTFKSGSGDCIFFTIKDEAEQFVLMVDCGKLEPVIYDYILNDCHGRIDLLIVTHIDDDHIAGVDDLLRNHADQIEVGEIIYNCYRRSANVAQRAVALPKQQKQLLENLKSELPVLNDLDEHNIGARGSFSLANTILSNAKFKKIWKVDTTITTTPDIELGKWGRIRFVSPTQDDIVKLNETYLRYFFEKLFMKSDDKRWQKGESIYEYIIRYADIADYKKLHDILIGSEIISADVLEKASKEPVDTKSITPSNKASLAFVWESADESRKVLFMGDANPETISVGLINIYNGISWPIRFEAIKVSHHGSHYNTTAELMRQVDTDHYFITGGEEGMRPHKSTIGKIVCRPLSGNNVRTLHFNFITEDVKNIEKSTDAKTALNFECDLTLNEHVFEF